MTSARRPVIHAIYRYTDAENGKARPPYFSKELALTSFVQAVNAAADDVAVTFLVDGAVAPGMVDLMQSVGVLRNGTWSSNRASYAEQLRLARSADADLVWFAEDDYLYADDALVALASAVRAKPDVDWFALSGPTPLHRLELRHAQSAVTLPRSRRWPSADPARVGQRGWRRIDSTTSTFGGRPSAVRSAFWLLRMCPWSGAAWDRTTCLALQGATPYPWRYLLSDLLPASTPARHKTLRVAWRIATRLAVNVAAMTQRRQQAVLVSPAVPLVAHLELPLEERADVWLARAAALAQHVRSSRSADLVR